MHVTKQNAKYFTKKLQIFQAQLTKLRETTIENYT